MIRRITVLGAGTMGHGIAQVAAMAGYEVIMRDIEEKFIESGYNRIKKSLEKLVKKGKITREEADLILKRIKKTTNLEEAVKQADFVIEAVPEVFEIKAEVFKAVDELAPPHAIIATNTSSLPISELAEATNRPDKFVGMHFFNPPQIMKLVEVVRGNKTSEQTVNTTLELAKSMKKEPVVVNKDVPGFIVNRVLVRWLNEACLIVERGESDILTVDSSLKYVAELPMGAFELSDFIGIDVMRDIIRAMVKRGFKLTPCKSWDKLVEEGKLGAKSSLGFYDWSSGRPNIPKELSTKFDPKQVLAMAVNEGAWLVREGVASTEDVDKAVILGLNFPKGVLSMGDEWGLDVVKSIIEGKRSRYGLPEYEVDPLIEELVSKGFLGVKSGKGFHDYGLREEDLNQVKYKATPPIAWIILNRPDKLNALDMELLNSLRKALDMALDDEIKVVVITGSGKAFSAGADVSMFKGLSPIDAYRLSRELNEFFDELERYPKPTIASINGFALGGGLELAMACDLRVASDRAQLGQPEITLGIITGAGGSKRLPKLVGLAKAKELLFTGDIISADEAEKIGLVNRVVPHEKLEEEVRSLALKIASMPSNSIRLYKSILNGEQEPLAFGLVFSTEDSKEGINAFLEKRRPKFSGK